MGKEGKGEFLEKEKHEIESLFSKGRSRRQNWQVPLLLHNIFTHSQVHMARSWRRLKVFRQLATVVNQLHYYHQLFPQTAFLHGYTCPYVCQWLGHPANWLNHTYHIWQDYSMSRQLKECCAIVHIPDNQEVLKSVRLYCTRREREFATRSLS